MTEKSLNPKDVQAIFFDPNTGEEINHIALVVPRKGEKLKDWLMIFHRGTMAMALDPEIRGETYRVFMYVLSHIDYENRILVTQMDVVKGIGMKQQSVNRAFKQLTQKGILLEGKKYGTVKTYYLNIDYGWKGSARNLKKKAKEQLDEQSVA